MKTRLFALMLTLALLLTGTAMGYSRSDFADGAPSGITTDGDALIVTDTTNHLLWRVEGDKVTFFAGKFTARGDYYDDTFTEAEFEEPWAVVPFLNGYAVSDTSANVIRYLEKGEVMTAVGSGKAALTNGSGTGASFDQPTGLAVDESGKVYIADTGNNAIRVMDTKGKVTTLLSGVKEPTGLCWADGTLYVAETGKNRICCVENGKLKAIAGIAEAEEDSSGEYVGGYTDGLAAKARFDHPQGITVSDGVIYVADTNNHAIRKIENDRVTTVTVSRDSPQGPVKPRGILLKDSKLYVADAFLGTLLVIDPAYKGYTDVKAGVWYADSVRAATERGLVNGTAEGVFTPDAPVTRAMFATMLSRVQLCMDGNTVINGDGTFNDITSGSWYAGAARWACDNGIVNGINGNFAGELAISREQLVTMLYRYATAIGCDVSAGEDTNLLSFADAADTAEFAVAAFQWACGIGVVDGYPDGTLRPQDTVTRAQAAKILVSFMDHAGI